jgi:Domain of unknown function (DUF5602)
MKTIKFLSSILCATILLFSSCKKDEVVATSKLSYGTEVKLGNGTAKSFVKINEAGVPEEVGVAISETAFNSLPHSGADLVLNLPDDGSKTPYKHIFLNYLHGGHEPAGIYTVDHFDVHFYTVPSSLRESIATPTDPRLTKFPTAGYLPGTYIPAGPVPTMGFHWVDSTAVEFKGQPFSSTFIYGSLDGNIIFNEPMIAIEYMKKKTHDHFPIKQPAKFDVSGYFPTEYCVRFNDADKQYEVALEELKLR